MIQTNKFVFLSFLLILFLSPACSLKAKDGIDVQGKILFYSNRDQNKLWGIYLYENGQVKYISRFGLGPIWFPGAMKWMGAGCDDGGDSAFCIHDLKGNILERFDVKVTALNPDFLPDYSGFVYKGVVYEKISEGKILSQTENLYQLDLSSRQITQLTNLALNTYIYSFDVSPVAEQIAYSWCSKKGEQCQAFLLDLKTGEEEKLGDYVWNVQWTPDGKKLYYETSGKDGQKVDEWRALFVYDPATKVHTPVKNPFGSTGFRFSPDGKNIIYSDWCANGICLYVMDLKTLESQPLLKPVPGRTINDTQPAWYMDLQQPSA